MFCSSGVFEEGELPPDPVFPESDHMDCFMREVCDALRDGSLGIDLNIDLESASSIEPTISYSGTSPFEYILLSNFALCFLFFLCIFPILWLFCRCC